MVLLAAFGLYFPRGYHEERTDVLGYEEAKLDVSSTFINMEEVTRFTPAPQVGMYIGKR